MVNHYEVHTIFQDIEHQLQGNILHDFLQHFMKSSLNREEFFTHSKLFTGSFWDIAQPHKLFTCQYLIYENYLFL